MYILYDSIELTLHMYILYDSIELTLHMYILYDSLYRPDFTQVNIIWLDTADFAHVHIIWLSIQLTLYSPFRGRWDSKWSSEWKTKSSSKSWNYFSRSLFTWKFEQSHKMVVSWFHLGYWFAFRWPLRVSSSTEGAIYVHIIWLYRPDFAHVHSIWLSLLSHMLQYTTADMCKVSSIESYNHSIWLSLVSHIQQYT